MRTQRWKNEHEHGGKKGQENCNITTNNTKNIPFIRGAELAKRQLEENCEQSSMLAMATQLKTFHKITISKSQVTNITVLIHPIRPGVQHISDPTFSNDIRPTTHQKGIDNIRLTPPLRLTNKTSNVSADWAKDKDKAAATFLEMIIGIVSTSSQEAVKLKTIRWPSLSLVL